MKRFLYNLLIAIGVYCVMIIGTNYLLFFQAHKRAFYDREFNTLIAGDSGFILLNEVDIPNGLNITELAGIYKEIYYKTLLVSKFREFDNLVIPFSYSSISIYNDKVLDGTDHTTFEHIKRLYAITNPFTMLNDGTDKITGLEIMAKYVLSVNVDYINSYFGEKKFDLPFMNNRFRMYYNKPASKPPQREATPLTKTDRFALSVDKRLEQLYYKDNQAAISLTAEHYLNKIVTYCKNKNIKLFLIRMPLSTPYHSRIPQMHKERVAQLQSFYEQDSNNTFLNYVDFFKGKENLHYFNNCDHVSLHGAGLISREIGNNIRN